jgi:hypothetical protein
MIRSVGPFFRGTALTFALASPVGCGGSGGGEQVDVASLGELRDIAGCTPPAPGDTGWGFADSGFGWLDSGFWWGDSGLGDTEADDSDTDTDADTDSAGDDTGGDSAGDSGASDTGFFFPCIDPLADDDADGVLNQQDVDCVCWELVGDTGDYDGDGSPNWLDDDCDGDGLIDGLDGENRGKPQGVRPPGQPCVGRDLLDEAQGGCNSGLLLSGALFVLGVAASRRGAVRP